MAALLTFHILGLYPVPSSRQLLIGSPLVSSFTIKNPFFGKPTTFTVNGFDSSTLNANPVSGSRVFVKSVTINGMQSQSICFIDWTDVVGGSDILIEVDSDSAAAQARGCGPGGVAALPDSLETGGFSM
jgi:putative alpha-1,2-mannosidase